MDDNFLNLLADQQMTDDSISKSDLGTIFRRQLADLQRASLEKGNLLPNDRLCGNQTSEMRVHFKDQIYFHFLNFIFIFPFTLPTFCFLFWSVVLIERNENTIFTWTHVHVNKLKNTDPHNYVRTHIPQDLSIVCIHTENVFFSKTFFYNETPFELPHGYP